MKLELGLKEKSYEIFQGDFHLYNMYIMCYIKQLGIVNKILQKGDIAMKSISILNKLKSSQSLKQNNETCYSFNYIRISCDGIQR